MLDSSGRMNIGVLLDERQGRHEPRTVLCGIDIFGLAPYFGNFAPHFSEKDRENRRLSTHSWQLYRRMVKMTKAQTNMIFLEQKALVWHCLAIAVGYTECIRIAMKGAQ
jgi:hypothetical protein